MTKKCHLVTSGIIAIIGFTYCSFANAYNFVPSDYEWQSWPGYCQAKYVLTIIGKTSKYANSVSQSKMAELAKWEADGISGVHHYCTGTIWLSRAKLEPNPDQKRYMLRNAISETSFSYERSNVLSPKFSHVAVQLALAYYEQGESDRALQILVAALANQPHSDMLYSATAIIQRRLGDLEAARETLLQGFEAVAGKSAEICYNLGLISLELGEVDEAEKYAELAYEQNYPLPGLRNKLERMGRM